MEFGLKLQSGSLGCCKHHENMFFDNSAHDAHPRRTRSVHLGIEDPLQRQRPRAGVLEHGQI